MQKISYFFRKKDFVRSDITQNYYEYCGYSWKDGSETEAFPLSLYFARDELSFLYTDKFTGKIWKVFSLYVADGEINQKILIKKIEDYWKMRFWKPPEVSGQNGGDSSKFNVDESLSTLGFFAKLYPHDQESDNCEEIDFRRVFLDFLYEMAFAGTFEDDNFYRLQTALKNNALILALLRKCHYLEECKRIDDQVWTELPKSFTDAEESWLAVCYQDNLQHIFISNKSLFASAEEEVEKVFFQARLGKYKRKRTRCFNRKSSLRLRNQSATFFLRQYAIWSALKVSVHPLVASIGFGLFFLCGAGEFFSKQVFNVTWLPAGLFSHILPILFIVALIIYNMFTRINTFKLLLPRMFLGIMMGWFVFAGSEESWKSALMIHSDKIIILNTVLFVVIAIYVYTDIRNKLIKSSRWRIFWRTLGLMCFAIMISLTQGFYVIQFNAEPMLEYSGFLDQGNCCLHRKADKLNQVKDWKTLHSEDFNEIDLLTRQTERQWMGIPNFQKIRIHFLNDEYLYFLWSVHLSQCMMAILVGMVLQLLWEDRPVTEPL